MWREELESTVIARWNKLVVDQQLRFEYVCHIVHLTLCSFEKVRDWQHSRRLLRTFALDDVRLRGDYTWFMAKVRLDY